MKEIADKLPDNMQELINRGVSGIDIIHGHLKNLMYEAQADYDRLVSEEEADDYSDAMLSMERTHAEGTMDAYAYLYRLTYDISHAEAIKAVTE